MSVDLRSNTMFSRISVVLMDDCLVKLEHGRTADRVRRFMFDGIESVIVWRKIPWIRIVVCVTFLLLPGVALLFPREPGLKIFGVILIAIGAAMVVWYLICRSTTIRITRGGIAHDLTGVFRPKKVERLRDRLIAAVRAAQSARTVATPIPFAAEAEMSSPAPPPLPRARDSL